MKNKHTKPRMVKTVEGVVVERYPYEDEPTSVQARGAYQEGVIDGAAVGASLAGLVSLGVWFWASFL